MPGLLGRSPDRIILDRRLRIPVTAKVYRFDPRTQERVWVALDAAQGPVADGRFAQSSAEVLRAAPMRRSGVKIEPLSRENRGPLRLDVPTLADGSLDLERLVGQLAAHGLTRLMVEGGPTLWKAFLGAGLVDEVCIVFGEGRAAQPCMPVLEGLPEPYFADFGLTKIASRMLGPDRLHIFRRESMR